MSSLIRVLSIVLAVGMFVGCIGKSQQSQTGSMVVEGSVLTPSVQPIFPAALKPGDRIRLETPARGVAQTTVDFVKSGLEKLGYIVEVAPNATSRYGYLGGTDEERAVSLNAAFADPDLAAIFCLAGGYGVTRLLDKLNFEPLKTHPKIITGFSDITALHLAVWKETSVVTFHAPTQRFVLSGMVSERPYTGKWFWRAVAPDSPLAAATDTWITPDAPGYLINADGVTSPVITVTGGIGRGRLIGGNLSLVSTLEGTPWAMDTDGAILFLEDVGEPPYRVDRMLSQLKLAGKLDNLSGVVIGYFSPPREGEGSGFTLREVHEQYFANKGYPVLLNFPIGHETNNATIPVGVMAELDGDAKTIRLLEDPVR